MALCGKLSACPRGFEYPLDNRVGPDFLLVPGSWARLYAPRRPGKRSLMMYRITDLFFAYIYESYQKLPFCQRIFVVFFLSFCLRII